MSFVSKDIFEYITNFSDDKTILNMLSVNKKFQDASFFQKIMSKRYPFLLEFKRKNQTWKSFYVETIYYLSRIEEKYGVPYIPTKGYKPKEFYLRYKNLLPSMLITNFTDLAMDYAIKGGNIEIVKLLSQKEINPNLAMWEAIKMENMEITKLMIDKGADDFNWGLSLATETGNMEMVNLMIDKGATAFDMGFDGAIRGGHLDLAKFFIIKGLRNIPLALNKVQGHPELLDLLNRGR